MAIRNTGRVAFQGGELIQSLPTERRDMEPIGHFSETGFDGVEDAPACRGMETTKEINWICKARLSIYEKLVRGVKFSLSFLVELSSLRTVFIVHGQRAVCKASKIKGYELGCNWLRTDIIRRG